MDSYQHQYDFPIDEAVKKWRILTANDGILLEKEFNVCFDIFYLISIVFLLISLFERWIKIVQLSELIQ
jgi:hypothetical protein